MKRFKPSAPVALMAAGALALAGCSGGSDTTTPDNGANNGQTQLDPGNCQSFYVWTSPEKLDFMKFAAQAFKQETEKKDPGNCYAPQVVSVSSGDAATYLEDMSKNKTQPLPALWSPASSIWLDYVSQSTTDIVGKWQSFATTPVVIAMPEPMARELGWPGKMPGMKDFHDICLSGWSKRGGAAATWGDFKLFKTNPNSSTTGLNMVMMQAFGFAGKTKGLTVNDVKSASTFNKEIESCAPHYGDTTGGILKRIADKGNGSLAYASAIAVEEKSVIDFNRGNPNGDPGIDPSTLHAPSIKLVAVYPSSGSLVSDNPTAVLGKGASWVTPEARAGAQKFAEFLQTDAMQDMLDDYGFRPVDTKKPLAGLLTTANGVNPQQKITYLEKPSAEVIAFSKQQWEMTRKPSNIKYLLDGSGSMSKYPDGASKSYLQGAKDASIAGINLLRPTDNLGINVFAGSSMVTVRPVTPIGDSRESGDLANMINGIAADGGTPLYDSTWAAYQQLSDRAEPGSINAIVLLSDGEQNFPNATIRSIDQLVKNITASIGEDSNKAGQVMIFPVVYGHSAPKDVLIKLAEATGGQIIDASDASMIDEKMLNAFRNF